MQEHDTDYSPAIEVPEERPRKQAIRDAFDELDDVGILDNQDKHLIRPALAIVSFALPAAFPLLISKSTAQSMSGILIVISAVLIGIGVAVYGLTYVDREPEQFAAGEAGTQDEPVELYHDDTEPDADSKVVDYDFNEWPWTFPIRPDFKTITLESISDKELQILLTEYQQVSEEGRYRDRLFNRSMYFGLAIIALLAAAVSRVDIGVLPGVLMVSTLVTFVFAMVIAKYKDARDPLWKRQRDLERFVPAFRGRLTTFHTIRTPQRRKYDKLSFTSFLVNLYTALWILSLGGYLVSLVLWLL